MNAKYFQSWKFILTMTALVTIVFKAYGIFTRPVPHNLPAFDSAYFVNGQPADFAAQRKLAVGTPPESLDFTLAELLTWMKNAKARIQWEQVDRTSFILRSTIYVAMEKRDVKLALQLIFVEPGNIKFDQGALVDGAVVVTLMAIDDETLDPDDMVAFLVEIRKPIDYAKGIKRF